MNVLRRALDSSPSSEQTRWIDKLATLTRTATSDTSSHRPVIFIPLYIYPSPGAWGPLIASAKAQQDLEFHAVVNPNNGPGDAALPDDNYIVALRELSTLDNVKVLGYVHATYGRRSEQEMEQDIRLYRDWSRNDPGLRVDGIFFDEVPSAPESAAKVARIAQRVRSLWGPKSAGQDDEEGIVVLNPGVVVSRELYSIADYIVAFEQSYQCWQTSWRQLRESIPAELRAKTVVMVHTCPAHEKTLGGIVSSKQLGRFGGQFVTEEVGGGYTVWSPSWHKYINLVSSKSPAIAAK